MFLTLVSWVVTHHWERLAASLSGGEVVYPALHPFTNLGSSRGAGFFLVFFSPVTRRPVSRFLNQRFSLRAWESQAFSTTSSLLPAKRSCSNVRGENMVIFFFYQKKLQPDISGTLIYKLLRLLQISQYYHKKTNTICAHCWRRNPNPFIPTVHSEFFC